MCVHGGEKNRENKFMAWKENGAKKQEKLQTKKHEYDLNASKCPVFLPFSKTLISLT